MTRRKGRDEGAVLPLVLIATIILSVVVVAITTFATTNLRYSDVTERRSDQLAAADAAMSYAVNLLELRVAECIYNDENIQLPALAESFNGATGEVDCVLTGGGLDSAALFAMVLTGEGLASTDYLVRTQSGGVKEISGPVFMESVDSDSFDLTNNNGLRLDASPLLHYDDTTPSCEAISEDLLPDDLEFVPDEIYGPICSSDTWHDYGPNGTTFDEPAINANFEPAWSNSSVAPYSFDGGAMQVYDGTLDAASVYSIIPLTGDATETRFVHVRGGYVDSGDCRIFQPGRYLTPPVTDNKSVYFLSGDYVFDFRDANQLGSTTFADLPMGSLAQSELELDKTVVTAGAPNPNPDNDLSTSDGFSQLISNPDCASAVSGDLTNIAAEISGGDSPLGKYGATFYFAGSSHLSLNTQAVVELMPRNKGTLDNPLFVSIHALCNTTSDSEWCAETPAGITPSDRQAPGGSTGDPALVWIKAGNNSEIVAQGLIWAPRAEMHFKNVSNSAEVRIRGGMVVARATIDASASASNFEIGVGSQDIDLELALVATGTDTEGRSTRIRSNVDLHYDEPLVEDRLDVLSWRVCERPTC